MTYDVKSVELSTGMTLQYVERGERSGVPVLLLPGAYDAWNSYVLLLPHLPDWIRAFALTLRGHGDASKPETGYGFRDFAADIVAFMDAQDLESAFLIAHSFGTLVATRCAIDAPERVRGLVLIGGLYRVADIPSEDEFWQTVMSPLEDPVDPEFVRELQSSVAFRPVPEPLFETLVREPLKIPARVWKAVYRTILEDDHSGELRKITASTLLVWGAHDDDAPRDQQDSLLAAIEDSRLIVYDDVGHSAHWEVPERLANDLVAFVEGLPG